MMKKEIINISIPGDPQTKKRPRFSRHKGQVRTYNSTKDEDDTFKWQLKVRMKETAVLSGPIEVKIVFYMPIPKSTSKKKKELMFEGKIKHVVKCDVDNLAKFTLDCMNGIVYNDDRQIYKLTAIKQYDVNPRTEITLWEELNQDKDLESGPL